MRIISIETVEFLAIELVDSYIEVEVVTPVLVEMKLSDLERQN